MRRLAGTSLLELIIAMAIAAVLCAGAALCLSRWAAEARLSQAQIEMERIAEDYHRHVLIPGRTLPESVRELPGYADAAPLDPWGMPYLLKQAHACGARVESFGPDRDEGTDDDLMRAIPPPKTYALPAIARAPRPPTNELLKREALRRPDAGPSMRPGIGFDVRLVDRLELFFVDIGARGSASFNEHRHVLALGGGRMHYRAMLPATKFAHVQIGAWFCERETRYPAGSDLKLTVNRKPIPRRVSREFGEGWMYLWDVPAALVNNAYTMQFVIGLDGEGEGVARTLQVYDRLWQGCSQRFVWVDLEYGTTHAP